MNVGEILSPGRVETAQSNQVERANPEKVREAAAEFEALLIGQMLRGMRESGSGGWLGSGSGESESLMEMAEQQLARVLAARGGLGLATLVTDGLKSK
jgi:Rod binding domain-containing protein